MESTKNEINEVRTIATLSQAEIEMALINFVAAESKIGIGSGVTAECFISNESAGGASVFYKAKVTIIENRRPRPSRGSDL